MFVTRPEPASTTTITARSLAELLSLPSSAARRPFRHQRRCGQGLYFSGSTARPPRASASHWPGSVMPAISKSRAALDLTHVQPTYSIGEQAASLLLSRIENPRTPRSPCCSRETGLGASPPLQQGTVRKRRAVQVNKAVRLRVAGLRLRLRLRLPDTYESEWASIIANGGAGIRSLGVRAIQTRERSHASPAVPFVGRIHADRSSGGCGDYCPSGRHLLPALNLARAQRAGCAGAISVSWGKAMTMLAAEKRAGFRVATKSISISWVQVAAVYWGAAGTSA